MAHTITNGYSLFKKRTVLCESLRVTTEKTGLDWFSRGPQGMTHRGPCLVHGRYLVQIGPTVGPMYHTLVQGSEGIVGTLSEHHLFILSRAPMKQVKGVFPGTFDDASTPRNKIY